jgi:hypothetical protein
LAQEDVWSIGAATESFVTLKERLKRLYRCRFWEAKNKFFLPDGLSNHYPRPRHPLRDRQVSRPYDVDVWLFISTQPQQFWGTHQFLQLTIISGWFAVSHGVGATASSDVLMQASIAQVD